MSTRNPATSATAPSALDFTRLQLRGDIMAQDSFSMAMVAAAGLLGRQADYDSVYLLSGNPFAPDLRPEEPSKHHWHIQGRERVIDLVCAQLGLRARPFPKWEDLAVIPPMPKDARQAEEWLRDYYRKPAVPVIRQALARGEVIVSMGEWDWKPGFNVTWTEWGIVTDAQDDGTIVGAASNGRLDNPITHVRDAWILSVDPGGSPSKAVDAEILRRAVARIRGDAQLFAPGSRGIVFGLPAMDAWIGQMRVTGFCPECGRANGWRCARLTAESTYHGATAAAGYLQRLAGAAAAPAHAPLGSAAQHYQAIADLLGPFVSDPAAPAAKSRAYQTVIGDAGKQQAHIDAVLTPVRAHLAAVADDLENALPALVP